mgnify:CR=1 FL=1
MNGRPSTWLFLAVAALIAALAFMIGQGQAGAGVIVAIFLSTTWTIYAQQRWGKNNG